VRFDDDSEDEGDDEDYLEVDEGEDSDGIMMGFEYDDEYMCLD
jgi:hypothetical protein